LTINTNFVSAVNEKFLLSRRFHVADNLRVDMKGADLVDDGAS
jgi:hypothetical protein